VRYVFLIIYLYVRLKLIVPLHIARPFCSLFKLLALCVCFVCVVYAACRRSRRRCCRARTRPSPVSTATSSPPPWHASCSSTHATDHRPGASYSPSPIGIEQDDRYSSIDMCSVDSHELSATVARLLQLNPCDRPQARCVLFTIQIGIEQDDRYSSIDMCSVEPRALRHRSPPPTAQPTRPTTGQVR
jgi:hypothetical protein